MKSKRILLTIFGLLIILCLVIIRESSQPSLKEMLFEYQCSLPICWQDIPLGESMTGIIEQFDEYSIPYTVDTVTLNTAVSSTITFQQDLHPYLNDNNFTTILIGAIGSDYIVYGLNIFFELCLDEMIRDFGIPDLILYDSLNYKNEPFHFYIYDNLNSENRKTLGVNQINIMDKNYPLSYDDPNAKTWEQSEIKDIPCTYE